MSQDRAAADPYTTSFEATVRSVDGPEVILEQTYFYPEGGGQPPDRGTIAGIGVEDVQRRGDAIVHTLTEAPTVEAGDHVDGEVDVAFRTYCMRAHTASHVLYGAGRRLLEDLGYGGFGITDQKVRVDFATPTTIDDDTLLELERLVNRAVWDSRPVTWDTYPEDEALALEGIAFNTKTEEGLTGESVRVVTVGAPQWVEGDPNAAVGEPWDVAACGGTHVSNTREIGPVTVLDRSNPGEGLTRIELSVGPPGIEARLEEKTALLEAADALGTAPTELVAAVERLEAEQADLETAVEDLRNRLLDSRLDELRNKTFERAGRRWLVGEIEGVDANTLGDRAKDLVGQAAGVVVLVGHDDRTFLAVAGEETAADKIVNEVTAKFGGGGGGSAAFAQGGGIDVDPSTIVEYLRE